MTEFEVQEKIDELRTKRRAQREDYGEYELQFDDTPPPSEKKDEGVLSVITTQCIIVIILIILYILALTFFPSQTRQGVSQIKTIFHSDQSFKDTIYQTLGDMLTDLSLSTSEVTALPVPQSLEGIGGERQISPIKSLPYNATLADVIYTGNITYPVAQSRNTSTFGFRINPITGLQEFHNAIDIAAVHGSPIVAVANGVVERSGFDASLGNFLVIDHGNGFKTKYGHCSELLVSSGDYIKEGDEIAKIGSTGDSTGPHLHFASSKNGVYFNPQHLYSYVEKWSEGELDD